MKGLRLHNKRNKSWRRPVDVQPGFERSSPEVLRTLNLFARDLLMDCYNVFAMTIRELIDADVDKKNIKAGDPPNYCFIVRFFMQYNRLWHAKNKQELTVELVGITADLKTIMYFFKLFDEYQVGQVDGHSGGRAGRVGGGGCNVLVRVIGRRDAAFPCFC